MRARLLRALPESVPASSFQEVPPGSGRAVPRRELGGTECAISRFPAPTTTGTSYPSLREQGVQHSIFNIVGWSIPRRQETKLGINRPHHVFHLVEDIVRITI